MKVLDVIVTLLLIIGGLNWGLVGVANFNAIGRFIESAAIVHVIYILVGLAALYQLFFWKAIYIRWSCKK